MSPTTILVYFVNLIFGLIDLVLGIRVIFLLLGANSATPFVNWIYGVSNSLLYPFQGIFPSQTVNTGTILDISAIIALVVYTLMGYLITRLIRFISFNSTDYTITKTKIRT